MSFLSNKSYELKLRVIQYLILHLITLWCLDMGKNKECERKIEAFKM